MSAAGDNLRRAAVEAFFGLLASADYDAFFALWSDDCAFEMPFPAPGLVERYPGPAGVRRFFTTFRGALAEASWRVTRFVVSDGSRVLAAEGEGRCRTTGGQRYDNRYIWTFEFDRDDRLTLVREYSNPLVITDSFGGADVLGPAFG